MYRYSYTDKRILKIVINNVTQNVFKHFLEEYPTL